jgi:hypothetical protein
MSVITDYLSGLDKVLEDATLFKLRLLDVGGPTEIVIKRYYDFSIDATAKILAIGLIPPLAAIARSGGPFQEVEQRLRREFQRWGYNDGFVDGLLTRAEAVGTGRETVIRTVVGAMEQLFADFPKLREAGFPAMVSELAADLLGGFAGTDEMLRTVDLVLSGETPDLSPHDLYALDCAKAALSIDVPLGRNAGASIQLGSRPQQGKRRRNQLWQFLLLEGPRPMFRIRSDATKLFLSVARVKGEPPVAIQDHRSDDPRQRWYLFRRDRGDAEVVVILNAHYFEALDHGQTKRGEELRVRVPTGGDSQAFTMSSTRHLLGRVYSRIFKRAE